MFGLWGLRNNDFVWNDCLLRSLSCDLDCSFRLVDVNVSEIFPSNLHFSLFDDNQLRGRLALITNDQAWRVVHLLGLHCLYHRHDFSSAPVIDPVVRLKDRHQVPVLPQLHFLFCFAEHVSANDSANSVPGSDRCFLPLWVWFPEGLAPTNFTCFDVGLHAGQTSFQFD